MQLRKKRRRLKRDNANRLSRNLSQYFEHLEDRLLLAVDFTGDQSLVNDLVIRSQDAPAIYSSSERTIVTFSEKGPIDQDGVFAKVYDATGTEITNAFRTNTTIRGLQKDTAVGVHPDGSFVVSWDGRGLGDKAGVFFQQYDTDANPVGSETIVNNTTGGIQEKSSISTLPDGGFIVAWEGTGVSDFDGIFARSFNADGTPEGNEVLVNSTIDGEQSYPAMASDGLGNSVVSWSSRHQDGSDWGVYAQRISAGGEFIGGEILVNDETNRSQMDSAIWVDQDSGDFIITWSSFAQDGDSWGIYGQKFDNSGNKIGTEFKVNQSTQGHQKDSAVVGTSDGETVVAWSSGLPDGSGWEVHAQSLNLQEENVAEDTLIHQRTSGGNT